MNKTTNKMFDRIPAENAERVTEADLYPLPEVVQNYLRFTNILGKEKIKTVRLKQRGEFRLKPGQNFKNMNAVQYFNVDSIEFCWQGKVGVITATDRFVDGKGHMIVKLFGFIKVAYSEGPEVDQGEILRFLAEGVWFPSVFVNPSIQWQAIDEHAAKATITVNNLSASATFYFNSENRVERIIAKRYMEKDGRFEMAVWEIQIKEYKEFSGVMIPRLSHVVWKLKDGDFCWYKPEIYEIEYNVRLPY